MLKMVEKVVTRIWLLYGGIDYLNETKLFGKAAAPTWMQSSDSIACPNQIAIKVS